MVQELRLEQLKRLKVMFGNTNELTRMPNAILLWGPHESGKTYVLNKVLKIFDVKHIARVTAVDILCGRRAFLENIVLQLRGSNKTSVRCSSLSLFCQELISFCRKVSAEDGGTIHERVIIIVDRLELLVEYPDIVYAFERCQELTHHNICVIFNSTESLATLNSGWFQKLKLVPMPTVYFPQYTQDEITQIILNKRPPGTGSFDIRKLFASTIVSVSMHAGTCRDITSLGALVDLHYTEFQRSKAQDKDLGEFCRRLMMTSVIFTIEQHVEDCPHALEMVKGMKHILIAAYLASQNPTACFLGTTQLRSPKKRQQSASNETGPVTTGPKTFSQARLNAIRSKIVGKPLRVDTNFLVTIRSLCYYKLLVRSEDSLEDCKYRCLAHRNLIEKISETINFPLNVHLSCPV